MHRGPQATLVLSALVGSWLGMLAVHEFGHALHAWLSGGAVTGVDLPLVGFSQTHVSPNPHPQFVAWGGAVWGALVPLALWLVARRWAKPQAFLAAFFAGFCCLANGAYLAAGSFVGTTSDADGAHELLRRGAARWQLIAFGLIAAAVGIRLWHGLGSSFGLGAARGTVERKAATSAVVALIGWIVLYLVVVAALK